MHPLARLVALACRRPRAIVVGALVFNELLSLRQRQAVPETLHA